MKSWRSKEIAEEELKSDFENYEIIELAEKEIELNEGVFHNGRVGNKIRGAKEITTLNNKHFQELEETEILLNLLE